MTNEEVAQSFDLVWTGQMDGPRDRPIPGGHDPAEVAYQRYRREHGSTSVEQERAARWLTRRGLA